MGSMVLTPAQISEAILLFGDSKYITLAMLNWLYLRHGSLNVDEKDWLQACQLTPKQLVGKPADLDGLPMFAEVQP